MTTPIVSVIMPMYNEQEVIEESYRRLSATLEELQLPYEILLVNDGSRDGTLAIAERLHADNPCVKVLDFARNFGHQIAVTAGLDYASGEAVVIIDADLQDPPELIPDMLRLWHDGYDVVYGKRLQRKGDSAFKRFTAFAFYRTLNWLSGTPIAKDTGDFRLIDRKVVDAMRAMPEHNRFLRGMVSWVGFKQTALEFHRDERWAGETKYPLSKMLKLAANGIFSFSTKPLMFVTLLGCLMGGGGLLALIVQWILSAAGHAPETASFAISCLFLVGGIVLLALGIQGQYIGRIYEEAQGRPLYLLAQTIGFDAGPMAQDRQGEHGERADQRPDHDDDEDE